MVCAGSEPPPGQGGEIVPCTMELKQCPNSLQMVARDSLNNCEFFPCKHSNDTDTDSDTGGEVVVIDNTHKGVLTCAETKKMFACKKHESTKCKWNKNNNKCFVAKCSGYKGKKFCNANNNCAWKPKKKKCMTKACPRQKGQQTCMSVDGCVWSAETEKCKKIVVTKNCGIKKFRKGCNRANNCKWLPKMKTCVAKMK